MKKTCPEQVATSSPCALQPEPLFHGFLGGMPRWPLPPPHTDPLGEARRGGTHTPGCVIPTWASVGPVLSSPSTHQAAVRSGAGKREPVFPELLAGLLCSRPRPPLEPTALAGPSLFICAPRGTLGGHPLLPSSRKREGAGSRSQSLPLKCSSLRGWLSFSPASPWPAILASPLQRLLQNCLEALGTDCLV